MKELEDKRESLRTLVHRMLRIKANDGTPRLGDLATGMGLLSEEQLKIALEKQHTSRAKRPLIGEGLIQSGFLDESQLSILLHEQSRLAMSSSEAAEDEDEGLKAVAGKLKRLRNGR